MFRDRTNLYISYRQSFPRSTRQLLATHASDEEEQGLIANSDNTGGADEIELAHMGNSLAKTISDDVHGILSEIKVKVNRLEVLHRKNSLPGFDDRSGEEKLISDITYDITQDLHHCQSMLKKLDRQSGDPVQDKMQMNAKIALATKIQDASTVFRKLQSNYLKALKRNEGSMDPIFQSTTSSNTHDEDVSLSQKALQQSQQLIEEDDQSTQNHHIRQREREIAQIAEGIIELAEIFKDLQTMVIDQGTLLDRIDYNIENMAVNVKQADKELVQGAVYQKRSNKCKIILLLTLVVVGLLIVVIAKPRSHTVYVEPVAGKPAPAPPANDKPATGGDNKNNNNDRPVDEPEKGSQNPQDDGADSRPVVSHALL